MDVHTDIDVRYLQWAVHIQDLQARDARIRMQCPAVGLGPFRVRLCQEHGPASCLQRGCFALFLLPLFRILGIQFFLITEDLFLLPCAVENPDNAKDAGDKRANDGGDDSWIKAAASRTQSLCRSRDSCTRCRDEQGGRNEHYPLDSFVLLPKAERKRENYHYSDE